MNVFAGNITPDNEHAIEEVLAKVAAEALANHNLEDLAYDEIDIQVTFNVGKGCELAPEEVRFGYERNSHIVDLVAKADGMAAEGYVDISNCEKLRYVIERSYA